MWNIKKFEEIYSRYRSSGFRVEVFCRNECILESEFYYWHRKLRERDSRKKQSPSFVAIVFPARIHYYRQKDYFGQSWNMMPRVTTMFSR